VIASVSGVTVEGTPSEIAELMRAMKNGGGPDVAMLTPKQREVYDALAKHPNGAHYTALAEEMGLDPNVVNTRLAALVTVYKQAIVARVCAGTYKVV